MSIAGSDRMATPAGDLPTAGEDTVLHEVRGGIARITLNRPQAANALAPEQRDLLIGLFQAHSQDPAVRSVILRSAGKHFCSGADLGRIQNTMTASDRHVGSGTDRILTGALRLITAILDCRKPVVGAVQGVAAGLGLHVALACDLIVASAGARFFEPMTLRGLVVDGAGAYLLPRRIGLQRAKEMAFLGGMLPADLALQYGLVNRVVPEGELESETEALAAQLARGATSAIALTKRLLNESLDAGREQAFLLEAMSVEIQSKAEDVSEGVTAFIERRDPRFVGH
jgi:2-(1,2-epoxy-1,2-dihydrophenyl)acetyl-CoA isomerase